LKTVKDQNQALIEGFTYDPTGNRLFKQLGTTAAVPYTYAATDHKLSNTGTGVRSFDANGNTTNNVQRSMVYDERNRLTFNQISGCTGRGCNETSAKYNARGERVSLSQAGSGEIYSAFVYDESGKLLVEQSNDPAGAAGSGTIAAASVGTFITCRFGGFLACNFICSPSSCNTDK
jgi:hypothetical protein